MISSKIKSIFYTTLILSIFCIPVISIAETLAPTTSEDITVEMSPRNPEPYQDVTIKITSYSTDLDKAIIQWKNGSKVLLSGYGKTSYSFTTSGPNTNNSINIVIQPSDSIDVINKTVTINPSDIEILWESVDGYTPPFYKGKSLVAPESTIRAVAIPNTNTIKSGGGNITYNWKNADNLVSKASGYNKNSYVFKNNQINKVENITVSASSVSNTYSATKTINIPVTSPKIIFYKKSPTEGVLYNQALVDNTTMKEDEMTVVATPYFMSITPDNGGDLNYSWKINGNSIDTPSKKTELTVRPSSRGGTATIGFTLENLRTFFQKASDQLKLTL